MKKKKFNLVLGTAQLDKNYSFSKKRLGLSSFKKIIQLSQKKNNLFIDTALGYKSSEKILSKFNLTKFNIITKINNSNDKIIEKLILSKKKLRIKKFYGVLFHSEKELLNKKPNEFAELVKSLKSNSITNKIGVSIYTLKSLKKIINKFDINIIQLPANLFDKRFLSQKLLGKLRQKKIKVFARSIFLKGMLVNKKFRDENRAMVKYKKEFDAYENWVVKENIVNKKFFCINFILKNKINNIVIGFDNFNEYKEISNYHNIKYVLPPNFIKYQSDNNKLLRPDLW
jgi:aryl-alcohol dehydrogenase-like predicted oxidoreductase